jgi:hypothetical protein
MANESWLKNTLCRSMKQKAESYLKLVALLAALGILVHSCVELNEGEQRYQLNLRWVKAYPDESKESVETGLTWGLSFLGATLPKGSVKQAVIWKTDSRFSLDVSRVGIAKENIDAWVKLIADIKQSEEYQKKGALDLGRFLALTVNSSNHYYALTGVAKTYNDFRARFAFQNLQVAIVESGVSLGDRLIEISDGGELSTIAFVAHEGDGSLVQGSFRSTEFEVFDFMSNGQLRFAIYDSQGRLESAANPSATLAGKPAKCLWCHEISIQRPFYATTNTAGYYSIEEFEQTVVQKMAIVNAARQELKSDVDFSKTQDHTQMELLYISFMEPSAERLSMEWGVSVDQVQTILAGTSTHTHVEFPFLGELYNRSDIDHLAPYETLRVPEDARERSLYEPDFLNHP